MTTFSPKTPEPGWEKRWLREAWALVRGTPDILLVIVGLSVAAGLIKALTAADRVGLLMSATVNVTLACCLFSPLIAWGYFAIGRREGYVSGGFSGYAEAAQMSVRTGLFVLVCFATVWAFSDLVIAETDPEVPVSPITGWSVIRFAADGLAQGFIFGWAGMFRHLTVAMVGASPEENRIISTRAHDKLKAVFHNVTIHTLFVYFFCIPLPSPIVLVIYLLFFYWLYVSGREIIGGITGNKQTSQVRAAALGVA